MKLQDVQGGNDRKCARMKKNGAKERGVQGEHSQKRKETAYDGTAKKRRLL